MAERKVSHAPHELKDQIGGSGSARVAEEADVEAVAETVPLAQAKFDQHRPTLVKGRGNDPLGHEQDFRRRNFQARGCNDRFDLREVGCRGNDEFELVWIRGNPLAEDLGAESGFFVSGDPGGIDRTGGGRRIRQFRAERGEVAGDATGSNGAGGFNSDVFAERTKSGGEFVDSAGDHGLAASENHMGGGMFFHFFNNGIDRHLRAFGIPRGVGRVAPTATQIAAGRAKENRWHADEFALALDGIKNLGDQHVARAGGRRSVDSNGPEFFLHVAEVAVG